MSHRKRSQNYEYHRSTRRSRRGESNLNELLDVLEEEQAKFDDVGPENPTLDSLIDYVSKVDRAYKSGKHGEGVRYCTACQLIPCLPAMRRLQGMVGLKEVKQQVVDLILYIATQYHHHGDYLHSLIVGPPGVGKSTLIEILAELFIKLRICRKGHIIHAKADDLISKWIGGTAPAVVEAFDQADGGILVIDEAYQLGGGGSMDDDDRRSGHAVECLNMLNQLLSERRHRVICFLAGYKDLIEQRVFAVNPGLKSRFAYTFTLTAYNSNELYQILTRIAALSNWSVDEDCAKVIEQNSLKFKGQGRDIEHLFRECRIRIAVRSWKLNVYQPLVVSSELLKDALDRLKKDEKPEKQLYEITMMYN